MFALMNASNSSYCSGVVGAWHDSAALVEGKWEWAKSGAGCALEEASKSGGVGGIVDDVCSSIGKGRDG